MMNTQVLTKEKASSVKSEDNDSYSMFLGNVTSLVLCYYSVSFLIFSIPFHGISLPLYSSFSTILAFHLLIIQVPT